jgi:hypothetical protein
MASTTKATTSSRAIIRSPHNNEGGKVSPTAPEPTDNRPRS